MLRLERDLFRIVPPLAWLFWPAERGIELGVYRVRAMVGVRWGKKKCPFAGAFEVRGGGRVMPGRGKLTHGRDTNAS